MKLLRAFLRWLNQPSAARMDDVRAEIDAALERRRERRRDYQARARKGATTRIHNRFTGDRLVARNDERTN